MRAAIVGASGLVGSFLIKELCASPEIEDVLSLARKPLNYTHTKLQERLGDLTMAEFWSFEADVDLVFVCVGTTQAKTPDLEQYRAIDYGIPAKAGEWAEANHAETVSVISSMGAKASSKNFYLKTKGEMEEALQKMHLSVQIFRPSLILGPRQESRFGEKMAKLFMKLLKPLTPRNYRPIEAEDIAKAMLYSALNMNDSKLFLSGTIQDLAHKA